MINGKTQVFGLLGNPIEHTLSPFIHQLLYDEMEFNGTYNPFFVPEGQLEWAVKGMKGLSIKGLNVTIPYKIDVMQYLDKIDSMAEAIGACNTIVIQEEKLVGYNTDWLGLKKSCEYEGIFFKDKNCVILGAGGSARAVAMMCLYSGAKSITILNRTIDKADQIRTYIERYKSTLNNVICPIITGEIAQTELIPPQSILFQTTSVGMHPHIDVCPIDFSVSSEMTTKEQEKLFFLNIDVLVDIIYNPKQTQFMKLAEEHGVKTCNGLGMLFFQAVSAFELWTGLVLSEEQIKRAKQSLEVHVYGQRNI